MDIDVKNAYQKAVRSCGDKEIQALLSTVWKFIQAISLKGAKDRFDEFCRDYVKKDVNTEALPSVGSSILSNPDVAAFFVVLGKYYLFSRFDKKDIDRNAFLKFIGSAQKSAERKEAGGSGKQIKNESAVKKAPKHQEPAEETVESIPKEEQKPEKTLEELKEELHSMIGLDGVKEEVDQIINLISLQKKGEELGEKKVPLSLHLVFYGNPGTGKTTVARMLAEIYKSLGVLSQGQLVETDRGGLVGGYVGQTAIKTQEVIDKAMGGILFIDEAYTLTHGKGESDFGQEAVDTILKAMEDHRDDFIVIVAGYPDLMKEFINSNPGLKSRFNQYINFEDYTPEQLRDIFRLQCNKQNLILKEESDRFLLEYFTELYENRDANYANGRDVRNYFEKVIRTRANRLSPIIDRITVEEYRTIELEDLMKAKEMKKSNW